MANALKLLGRMRNNPRDWRIEDLKTVAAHFGVKHRQHGTSHVTFLFAADSFPVPVAKPINQRYVRQFVTFIDQEQK